MDVAIPIHSGSSTLSEMKPPIVLLSYILALPGGIPSAYALKPRDCDAGEIPEWHPPQPSDCKPRPAQALLTPGAALVWLIMPIFFTKVVDSQSHRI
jgi:hypothetical protein